MTGIIARAATSAALLATMLAATPAAASPPIIDPASTTVGGLAGFVAGATGLQPLSSSMAACMDFHDAASCARANQTKPSPTPAEPTLEELTVFLAGSVGL